MRTVLVTGLGGAGRTTVAVATALAAARTAPGRVLLLSAEPGDVLGTALTTTPAPVADGLSAARIDTAADFRAEFLNLQDRAGTVLDLLGAARLAAEELTELPGSSDFALLKAVTTAQAGDWDLVVVDMPPVREAIALLALPEQLRRYLRRLLPPERQAARALRPVLAQLAGVPMPAHWLYEAVARWDTELAAVQSLLESPGLTVRVVAEPGPSAADALRTARTGLALHQVRVDTLIANRVLPRHSADTWLAGLAAQQEKTLHEWYGEWAPATTVREIPHAGRDPRTLADLAPLGVDAEVDAGVGVGVGGTEPPRAATPWPIEDLRAVDGTFTWAIPLPGAVKEETGLVRRGDELLLTVGPFRRIVPLPSALRRCSVSGAALTEGTLRVRFTPDPGLWPRED